MPKTADLRIRSTTPLLSPEALAKEIPLPDATAAFIHQARRDIAAVLAGTDDRLLVVVGPCSIHDPAAALDYASRLRPAAERFAADLLMVMRVYFEKPRTVVGWKGLINDPGLDNTYQVNEGLRLARRLLVDVSSAGLPAGTEFLDATLGQYYADTVAWGAIGARTVESQIHRELASGLSMPVGFKNRTDGNLQVAVDAIRSARHPHWFPSLARDGSPAVLGTSGNDQTHLVLRGGSAGPNFSAKQVQAAAELLRRHALPASIMIDCSHANSGKDPSRQPEVATAIAAQIAAGERAITGVMIESHLQAGAQEYTQRPLDYGRSVTDACLSWEQTLPVFATLAEAVRARRQN